MRIFKIIFYILLPVSVLAQPQWVIYRTTNSGLPTNAVSCILIDCNNVKWITTDNGFVKLQGNTWTVYDTTNSGMPGNSCSFVVQDKQNNKWVTVTTKGAVKFDGVNWTVYNQQNTGFTLNSITSICIDSLNNKWIGYGGGLLKFNDTLWIRYHTGNSGIPSNGIFRLFNEGNVVWVGTLEAGTGRFDGQIWTNFNVYNSGIPSNWIYGMDKDIYNNIWFATRYGGTAKFNFNQNQWSVYNTWNSGLPNNDVNAVYVDNNNTKWFGMYEGCAIFNDITWQVFSYPFISGVFNFAKDRYGNMWICSDIGLYVYNPTGVVGVENNQTIISDNYTLIQNYPNPFNNETKIKYQVAQDTKTSNNYKYVSLKIYNILGKKIATLVNKKQEFGEYDVSFKGDNLASGIYLAVLKIDTKVKVHKLVLQK